MSVPPQEYLPPGDFHSYPRDPRTGGGFDPNYPMEPQFQPPPWVFRHPGQPFDMAFPPPPPPGWNPPPHAAMVIPPHIPQAYQEWMDDPKQEAGPSNPEVKHRRRTTPEQLKVLEFWFRQNPKPNAQMREYLAQQLDMTARNIQVWFQNRRAKVKQIKEAKEKDEEKDSGSSSTTPNSNPLSTSSTLPRRSTTDLPHQSPTLGMRRASLASVEAVQMEKYVAKRNQNPLRPQSPLTSISAVRRRSIPYATPQHLPPPAQTIPSPRVSPGAGPSALHLAAMHNSRRASMPTTEEIPLPPPVSQERRASKVLRTYAFTPPRNSATNVRYGLTPIKDGEPAQMFSSQSSFPPQQPQAMGFEYNMDVPLPNPDFHFGAGAPPPPAMMNGAHPGSIVNGNVMVQSPMEEAAMYNFHTARDRVGSFASLNTVTTDTGTEGEDYRDFFVMPPDGFDQSRRASAPADMLHPELLQQVHLLGLGPHPHHLRPSPLQSTLEPYAELPENLPTQPAYPTPSLFLPSDSPNSNSSSSDPSPHSAPSYAPPAPGRPPIVRAVSMQLPTNISGTTTPNGTSVAMGSGNSMGNGNGNGIGSTMPTDPTSKGAFDQYLASLKPGDGLHRRTSLGMTPARGPGGGGMSISNPGSVGSASQTRSASASASAPGGNGGDDRMSVSVSVSPHNPDEDEWADWKAYAYGESGIDTSLLA